MSEAIVAPAPGTTPIAKPTSVLRISVHRCGISSESCPDRPGISCSGSGFWFEVSSISNTSDRANSPINAAMKLTPPRRSGVKA